MPHDVDEIWFFQNGVQNEFKTDAKVILFYSRNLQSECNPNVEAIWDRESENISLFKKEFDEMACERAWDYSDRGYPPTSQEEEEEGEMWDILTAKGLQPFQCPIARARACQVKHALPNICSYLPSTKNLLHKGFDTCPAIMKKTCERSMAKSMRRVGRQDRCNNPPRSHKSQNLKKAFSRYKDQGRP